MSDPSPQNGHGGYRVTDIWSEEEQRIHSGVRRVVRRHDSEDVIQEIALAAENCDRIFQCKRDAKKYLHGIKRNKLREHKRQTIRKPKCGLDAIAETLIDPAKSPLEKLAIESLFQMAFEKLSSNDQHILHEVYFVGRSDKEIAQFLQVSDEVFWQRKSRAKTRFRKIIEDLSGDNAN